MTGLDPQDPHPLESPSMASNIHTQTDDDRAKHFLDITDMVCPMTFVHVRLLLESMRAGEQATILLAGDEPIRNVPTNLRREGHRVISLEAVSSVRWRLCFVKTAL